MKKLLCSILACLMLAGCAAPGGTSSSGSASSGGASSSAVDQSTPAPPAKEFKAEPIDFTWKPVVYSDYQRRFRAPEAEVFYHDCVEAMMKGETTVPCREELVNDLLPIMQYIFPVVNGILSSFEYRDGALQISYSVSDAEREQIIDAFGRRIEELVEQAVCKGDTPTMAAIALYHSFVGGLDYDFAALEDETATVDVTPYRALMTGEGICQSFGPAYAYLCMQLGINAIAAHGVDANEENGHSWMMMELNEHHYFCDPTFENSSGGGGLRCFGMNSDRRAEDNYLLKDIGLGFNLSDADEYDLSDDTFAPLWDVQNVYELCRTGSGMEIRGHIYFPAQRSIAIEDGKYLIVTPCDSDGNSLDSGNALLPDEPEEPSDPAPDLYSPIPESIQGSAWSSAGFDVAFVNNSTVWIDSKEYTGLGQCWISAEGQLTMEFPDEELEIHIESDERIILKGKNGEFPATRESLDLYVDLFDQMIAAREEENAVG